MTAALIDMHMHAPQTVHDLADEVRHATGEVTCVRDNADVVVHVLRTHPTYWPQRNKPSMAFLRLRLLRDGKRRLEIDMPDDSCWTLDGARLRDLIRWVHALQDGTADFMGVSEL